MAIEPDAVELLEPVADVEHAAAGPLQLADHREQAVQLLGRERCGRLVHQHDLRVDRQRLRDGHELTVRDGQLLHDGGRSEVRTDPGQQRLSLAVARGRVDEAVPSREVRQEQVLGDRHAGHQVQLLEDARDAGSQAVARAAEHHLVTVDTQLPGVGGIGTHDDLDQGALAGTVLADQAVDLAGKHRQVHVMERHDAGELLADPGRLEDRRQELIHEPAPTPRWPNRRR